MSNQMDSGSAANSGQPAGQQANPDQQNVQPSSPQVPFTEEQLAYLSGEYREQIRREVQSDKDRAVNRIERTVQTQQSQLDKFAELLKQPGMTVDKAKREMALDELLAERQTPQQQVPPVAQTNATGGQQTARPDILAIYSALGVDANNPDVLRITQETPRPEQLVVKLAEWKSTRQASGGNVSVGAVAGVAGGNAPSLNTQIETLSQEIEALTSNRTMAPRLLQNALAEKKAALAKLQGQVS